MFSLRGTRWQEIIRPGDAHDQLVSPPGSILQCAGAGAERYTVQWPSERGEADTLRQRTSQGTLDGSAADAIEEWSRRRHGPLRALVPCGLATVTLAMYLDELLGVAFVLAIAGVLFAYAIRTVTIGRAIDARVARVTGTVLLGRFPIEAIHWAARGAGFVLVRCNVAPDTLTLISLVITLASLPLAATGHHLLAGCIFLFGAAFDALDGIVARARGLACQAGEVLDSIVDRYADAAPLIGLAVYFRTSASSLLLVLAALVGSMMVSYVRAKHEALNVELPGWLMRRPERIAYLGAGLILGPLVGLMQIPHITSARVILSSVAVVGALSHVAAARLTLQGRAMLLRRASGQRR